MSNTFHMAKGALICAALAVSSIASAQVTLTPISRTGAASGPASTEAEPKAKPKKVAKAKPCKKKGSGGFMKFIKDTGIASAVASSVGGGGMEGYVAGNVASTAVDAAASAEQKAASQPAKC